MTASRPVGALAHVTHRDIARSVAEDEATVGLALVVDDGTERRHLPLVTGVCRIGRSHAVDLILDDPTVSRCHATLLVGADGLRVSDDRSTNGTFLNGERVSVAFARPGDELQFGRVRVGVHGG